MTRISGALLLAASAILLTASCTGRLTVRPGVYCTGEIQADIAPGATLSEAWTARAKELWQRCAPLAVVKVTL